jgi:hypothetical protein
MTTKPRLAENAHLEAFPDAFQRSVDDLRAAFAKLRASVPGLPERPLQMARFLHLDKNLAWKVARLAEAADAGEAVRHLPGPAGVKLVLDAFAEGGAGAEEIELVQAAVARFDRMVGEHTGDRATLELVLASGASSVPDAQRMEASRKLAFQGNSATFGVQARVRFGFQLLAPSAQDPELVDVAAVGGLVDFRRLRTSVAWPLISVSGSSAEGGSAEVRHVPLGESLGGLPILRDFCSAPLPEIRAVLEPNGVVYELAEGPVGDTAASTCVFGWRTPAVGSVRAGPGDTLAEFMLTAETPAEALVFELFVHRDLPFVGPPALHATSSLHGRPRFPLGERARYTLPLSEGLEALHPASAPVAHPLLPRHAELVETACARAGWRLADFRGHRLTVRFPPIPSVVTLSYPLLPPR